MSLCEDSCMIVCAIWAILNQKYARKKIGFFSILNYLVDMYIPNFDKKPVKTWPKYYIKMVYF